MVKTLRSVMESTWFTSFVLRLKYMQISSRPLRAANINGAYPDPEVVLTSAPLSQNNSMAQILDILIAWKNGELSLYFSASWNILAPFLSSNSVQALLSPRIAYERALSP